MAKIKNLIIALLALYMLFSFERVFPCSMYKVTLYGKTIVGSNHDAWFLTPRIWFETGTKAGYYGAAFTGARFDGANGYAPQSGMNEFGLAFTRLATHAPEKTISVAANKKIITNPTQYLKDIIHTCKTVEEVKDYISQYDHSFFREDVFIYIEKSGRYLIVEPDTMITGNEASYVLSNFFPSVTSEKDARKLDRYRKGVDFLKEKKDTTLSFCTALSDSMHVCRKKIGDGTLITSIWDLDKGITYLYFYHDYNHLVQFSLKDELAKGDHMIEIPSLFPPNAEFEKLRNFKIPQNSKPLMLFVLFCGGLFLFSAAFFLISFFKYRKTSTYSFLRLALVPLGIITAYYMYVLVRNIGIFYFPAPYRENGFTILNLTAYIPFLLLLLIIPLCALNLKIVRERAWKFFPKLLLTLNTIAYLLLTGLFAYWGLFNVFG